MFIVGSPEMIDAADALYQVIIKGVISATPAHATDVMRARGEFIRVAREDLDTSFDHPDLPEPNRPSS